jgi:hypothetical protein
MEQPWTPPLEVATVAGRCRLWLGGYAFGDGETLQDAADDLVARLLNLAMCFRSGFTTSREVPPPDLRWLDFVYEIGEIAARGGDIRERLFGTGSAAAEPI